MPGGNWRNGFAVGLTAGVSGATLLILFGQAIYDLVDCVSRSECDRYAAKHKVEDLPSSWWWRWTGDLVSSSDTLAQWIMALLTIAAVVLLWRTLSQTNKTNQAAIIAANAALDANAIIKQEQRPWVTLERDLFCEFQDLGYGGHITWNFDLQNRGKGPAYDIRMDFEIMKRRHWQGMRQQVSAYRDRLLSQSRVGRTAVLFPGETTENLRFWSDIKTTYKIDEFTGDESFWGEFKFVALMVCVTYRLGPESKDIGFDARIFEIERNGDLFGPWAHKIMEFTNARIIG